MCIVLYMDNANKPTRTVNGMKLVRRDSEHWESKDKRWAIQRPEKPGQPYVLFDAKQGFNYGIADYPNTLKSAVTKIKAQLHRESLRAF